MYVDVQYSWMCCQITVQILFGIIVIVNSIGSLSSSAFSLCSRVRLQRSREQSLRRRTVSSATCWQTRPSRYTWSADCTLSVTSWSQPTVITPFIGLKWVLSSRWRKSRAMGLTLRTPPIPANDRHPCPRYRRFLFDCCVWKMKTKHILLFK